MLIRSLSWFLGLSAVVCVGCEQNDNYQTLSGVQTATAIDSLTTRAQVQQFVRRWGDYCYGFIVADSLAPNCTTTQLCLSPEKRRSWVKADFDGDGRTDLLVTGRNSKHFLSARNIICILNKRQPGLQSVWLAKGEYNCAVAQVSYLNKKPIIRYAHVLYGRLQKLRANISPQLVCQADTLVFKEPGFIEYNRAPKDYQIQQIALSTEACFGSCPIFDLCLSRNGAATYRAKAYNKQKGTFTAMVDAPTIKELWTLLNYLDFPQLEEKYSVGISDQPTCTLTITYANGKVKTIVDYGEQGTFGLQRVYKLLFALRGSQAWK
ncbi:hypothetical protein FNT36_16380 [Hymenobacter setariae]|uniref:DUF6438 domain-containing protein n=1 Tax=Hymenobacter setariae TaxID=2594794 RepID=A0A558BRV8_9BACT|nr:DUF6438 domain-containing protein [Hymenobacter setariae]TVT39233.1 hypothetical protein FNT36_16380 [Hymenobacter setariae]